MLILIAGITGNIGRHCATYALSTGHTVRGLGRSPAKLDASLSDRLQSFITSNSYHDVPALDAACAGVDAIICAYAGLPELHLDGQLLLLRAAERAGVKRFLAAGWNYDWRKIRFGIDEPVYDAAMAFHRQAAISSGIRPCHIFSGMLAEVFFGVGGQTGFSPRDDGVWDCFAEHGEKVMDVWGTGDEEWYFTTEEDAGKWGVEIVTADGAEEGGFVTVCSFITTLNDIKNVYERVRGTPVKINQKGTTEDLEKLATAKRDAMGPSRMWDWHRYFFHLFCANGRWKLAELENDKFPNVRPTGLELFLRQHPEV